MANEILETDFLQSIAQELSTLDEQLSYEMALTLIMQCLSDEEEKDIFQLSNPVCAEMKSLVRALLLLNQRNTISVTERRPQVLECDVWRFQNKKEKWVAFVGLVDNRPYEIFTGLQDDEEGIVLPKNVQTGWIIKNQQSDGTSRYDFAFQNRRGYKITVEGLSSKFNKEYWNYAKLISGVLRYRMPVENVIRLIDSLQFDGTINTWKSGVLRALKKYSSVGLEMSSEDSDKGEE